MAKKYLFGVKYLIPFDVVTMKPKGIFEVIGGVEVAREIEKMLLEGGHIDGPYAVESGAVSNTMTATIKEYPDFAFEIFENAIIDNVTTESAGHIGTIINTKGTSVLSVGGIATATAIASEEATIPSGFIVVEATGVDTAKIYLAGDVASGRVPILSELPVLAEEITLTAAGTVDLAGYGLTITAAAGPLAMVTGDIAYFDVRPSNTDRTSIKVGADSGINYVGLMLVYPKNSEKEQTIIRFPKVAVAGMPFSGNSREFSEFEQEMTPLLSDTESILYEVIRTKTA